MVLKLTQGSHSDSAFRRRAEPEYPFEVHGGTNVAGAWMRRSGPYAGPRWCLRGQCIASGFIDNSRCYNATVAESEEFKIEAVGQVTA